MTEPDWRILDRYLAGDASPDEERAVREWIMADPTRGELIRKIRAAHESRDVERWDTDAAWAKFSNRVRGGQHRTTVIPLHPGAWYTRTPVRIAAALLLTVGSYATWQVVKSPRAQQPAMRELATPNGQRATATLGDGSRVILNAGSRLRYPADFGRAPRDVYLEGEAYFEVTHDAARPFRVHARDGVAHDLGTRFTVRAYPELPRVDVVVTEGRVSLRRDQATATDSVVLGPGQLGRLADSGPPAVVTGVDVAAYTGWTGGTLVLEGLPLEEALPLLDRWFDVEIRVADRSLASRRIYARFRDESLTQVLDALSLALGARSERSGRVITLHPAAPTSR
jgi:transmembrane sensor